VVSAQTIKAPETKSAVMHRTTAPEAICAKQPLTEGDKPSGGILVGCSAKGKDFAFFRVNRPNYCSIFMQLMKMPNI